MKMYLSYSEPIREVDQSIMFIIMFQLFEFVNSLPWTVYYTFVLEEKHGFNKQSAVFFIKDQIKSLLLSCAIVSIVMGGIVYIVQWGGAYFYVYAWIFLFVFSLFAITVYADYIAPLFDKFEPLADGPLKTKIEGLAESINFPLTKLWVVKASNRSSHSNAYFYGFFKNKRIVLFDTLFEHTSSANSDEDSDSKKTSNSACTDEEVVAILSHELGHWSLNHVLKTFLISQVNIFFSFFMFGYLMKSETLFEQFGFHKVHAGEPLPILFGMVIIFSYIFAPYNMIMDLSMTVLSRSFEFQADEFASFTLGYGPDLENALIKIQKGNLGCMNPDKWYSMYHYTHPPLVERLRGIRACVSRKMKKQN